MLSHAKRSDAMRLLCAAVSPLIARSPVYISLTCLSILLRFLRPDTCRSSTRSMAKKKQPSVTCWECKKTFKGEPACISHATAKKHKWQAPTSSAQAKPTNVKVVAVPKSTAPTIVPPKPAPTAVAQAKPPPSVPSRVFFCPECTQQFWTWDGLRTVSMLHITRYPQVNLSGLPALLRRPHHIPVEALLCMSEIHYRQAGALLAIGQPPEMQGVFHRFRKRCGVPKGRPYSFDPLLVLMDVVLASGKQKYL